MAEETGPADGQRDDPDLAALDVSLTDLIDQIERAAFERTLDGRHGRTHEPHDEPTGI